jgi:hypothetical protein
MVESDFLAAQRENLVRAHGYEANCFLTPKELRSQKELF